MIHVSLPKSFVVRLVCILSCLSLYSSFKPIIGQENHSTAAHKSGDSKIHCPANVTECIEELKQVLPAKGDILDEFKSHSIEIANDYHLTLGMWIRNNWIHSGDGVLMTYFENMGIYHPDDMSGIILDSLWKDLHSLPINLKEQVDEYKKLSFYESPKIIENRLVSNDIWNKPQSLNNGRIIRLSNFKGKVIVLLLFADDIFSPSAISAISVLQNRFSKCNVVFIGLYEKNIFDPKDQQLSVDNKSATFPLIAVESEFKQSIHESLISPGTLAFPQVILIGKDGNMIVRFNAWNADATSKKELYDEILNALKIRL